MNLPPLPPLPRGVLERVDDIERYAQKGLYECMGDGSFNIEKATRLLRSCATEGFDIQAEHYLSIDGQCAYFWLDEIEVQTRTVALGLARNAALPEDQTETLDQQLRQTLHPRLEYWKGKAQHPDMTVRADLPRTEAASDVPRFPRRAAWLKQRFTERGWNRNRPAEFGGPDPKTIDKILTGADVREDVLEKLANGLSKKYRKVELTEIPRD